MQYATPGYAAPGQFATPVYAAPAQAMPGAQPVYGAPYSTPVYEDRHHGVGMAVGAGVAGLAAGAVGGMMLENALERREYGMGYGGGPGFVQERVGPFGTDFVE